MVASLNAPRMDDPYGDWPTKLTNSELMEYPYAQGVVVPARHTYSHSASEGRRNPSPASASQTCTSNQDTCSTGRRGPLKQEGLHEATQNPSLKRCATPKVVFIVDRRANKQEIARAVEKIFAEQKIKVVGVNTINIKPKKKRARGREGRTIAMKKAIVSLEKGDMLAQQV